jgi:multidrug efflux pump subunit AcrA (membrane-fusion protein)
MVDNKDQSLRAGEFASVILNLPVGDNALIVPSSVLIYRKDGQFIATLGEGDKVILKKVEIARDMGTKIQIATGLNSDETIIDVPPDSLENEEHVRVLNESPKIETGEMKASSTTKK